MTFDESLNYLQNEILQYRKELDKIYQANIRYLDRIPKDAIDGVVKFGGTLIESVCVGVSCILLSPFMQGMEYMKKAKTGKECVIAAAKGVGMIPLSTVTYSIGGVTHIVSGACSSVFALLQGTVNTFRSNDKIMSTESIDKSYNEKYKEIISNCLHRQGTNIDDLPFTKRLYSKLLGGGHFWFCNCKMCN